MSEFKIIRLDKDSRGNPQNNDKRIARITSLFQSGIVHPFVAREAIMQISRGEDVSEIITLQLAPKPLEAVVTDEEIRKEKEAADAARAAAQGLAPRLKPTIES